MLGQDHITTSFRAAAARGTLHHAYLFVGPEGLGQEEAARWLAMLANCEAEGDRPCGSCHSCHLTATDSNPDVTYVRPSERSRVGKILLEQAQEIRSEISRRPVIGRRKVSVISPAEALIPEAVNCLLKTLEEPPGYAILVLIAADTTSVLPTIVSRCQVVRFLPVADDAVAGMLRAEGAEEPEATRLARLAQGRPDEALRLLREPARLAERQRALDLAERIAGAAPPDALRLAEDLRSTEEAGDVDGCLRWIGAWFRDVAALHAGVEEAVLNDDRMPGLRRAAAVYAHGEPAAAVDALLRARRRLAGNANKDLTTEALTFDIIPNRPKTEGSR